ncbi:tetratricopeptide (TPR) repeat protein/transcriptional regulator with XRE-family HTH domain [Saccharothrix tamanrassetensis]|uniref:Tetratricopeptide (TPR) repeat protein/transcriptional regulator with XRE-family HTH domain n=1 Tax=Saccharothrix tamanrassetensis TaxID=1051531 RepID=A0A841CBK0_9PSEU|nr:tetratricopeptide repeat protein [Saccharothrix tamanrassetensis]MBB5954323.1 tetratricopeptide (TPR) repeat protein/transcriptional regulator with XRE-family HTH domain [Saccharothrix tamanrassetensis]
MGERLAGTLRHYRRRAGLTQERLAERSGVSIRTIRGIETGERGNPQLVSVRQLAAALDLASDERRELLSAAAGAPEPTAGPLPRQLPPDIAGFVGRAAELARLDAVLPVAGREPCAVVVSAVSGTAGVGKTALAVRWAHRMAHHFPDGQLYANLRGFDAGGSVVEPAEALRGFLDALGAAPQRIPTGLDAQVGLYRSLVAGRRLLVVLDNARDADQVRPLLPGTAGCLVLVTSRNQLTSLVAGNSAHPLTLDLLSAAEAEQLLAARLGRERTAAEPAEVAEIVARCAGLPLALAVVAARAAARPAFPLRAVAAELREAGGDLDGLAGAEPSCDVRSVLSWSYRALDADAARAFARLGLAPTAEIGLVAATCLVGAPVGRVRVLLRRLEDCHLVEQHRPDRFRMHDLVHAYAAELARDVAGATRRAALRRLFDMYLVVAGRARDLVMHSPRIAEVVDLAAGEPGWPEFADEAEALDWLETERGTLLATVRWLAEHGRHDDVWRFSWLLYGFFRTRQHKADWLEVGRLGVSCAERLDDPVARFHAANCLGGAYMATGDWDRAIASYQDALAVCRADHDPAKAAVCLNNIGITLINSGSAEQAIPYLRRALAHARTAQSPVDVAMYSLNLGDSYCMTGRHREALTHGRVARELFHSLGRRYHCAVAVGNIAESYFGLGALAEAARHAEESQAELRSVDARFDVAKNLLFLGRVRAAQGRPDLARQAWEEALDTFLELDDPRATVVENLLRRERER